MRLLGLDPGLRRTGWGAIDVDGTRLRHVANGTVAPNPDQSLAARLAELYAALENVMEIWTPQSVAVEETFVNKNPASTLKLGQARGVVLLAPARAGLEVFEYHNRTVKQAVVGSGRAAKQQVAMMVATLLPGCRPHSEDAADALAVAICHAHHLQSTRSLAGALAKGAAA